MTPEELFEMARSASENAFCPVSDFPVGAALLCDDGRVFTGANVESPSIIQVFCAERVALVKALSEGARKFTRIAIATPKNPGATPCGLCRQMLFEFAPDLVVIVKQGRKLVQKPIRSLLPEGFRLEK